MIQIELIIQVQEGTLAQHFGKRMRLSPPDREEAVLPTPHLAIFHDRYPPIIRSVIVLWA